MPTIKQKKAFDNLVGNGGNVTKAMRDAKYSENTINTPQKLTDSKGWEELVEKNLPDSLLAKTHLEGLKAGKKIFRNNVSTKEIEEVGFEPDYGVRHKYLETAYKIKHKLVDKLDIDLVVSLVGIQS